MPENLKKLDQRATLLNLFDRALECDIYWGKRARREENIDKLAEEFRASGDRSLLIIRDTPNSFFEKFMGFSHTGIGRIERHYDAYGHSLLSFKIDADAQMANKLEKAYGVLYSFLDSGLVVYEHKKILVGYSESELSISLHKWKDFDFVEIRLESFADNEASKAVGIFRSVLADVERGISQRSNEKLR